MKILPKVIQNKGFTLKQIKRVGDKAIYEQTKKDYTHTSFEVIRISRHSGYELAGAKIAPAETYPGSSQWGINGWTYTTLADAEKKFKSLK